MHFAAPKIRDQMGNRTDAKNASVELLRDLIDYAGLFPPASLAMATVVANYEAYLQSEWSWILGRFVLPISRLAEFQEKLAGLPASGTELAPWRLSVLLSNDPAADVALIRNFDAQMNGGASGRRAGIESVEAKVANAEDISWLSQIIPAELTAYFEVPLSSSAECVAAIAACERRAKIRTGGETADKFPTSTSVVEFIRLCASAGVPFKATAGLHHPLRSVNRFTYQPDSASGIMHGFLNVFLAAAFLRAGMDQKLAVLLLEEQSPEAFRFEADEVIWLQHRLTRNEIADTRRDFAISFGSCSFTEPIDDLQSLYLL
jgi:hypothetical protein